MIIYSTKLWLRSNLSQTLRIINPWVTRKMGNLELTTLTEDHLRHHNRQYEMEIEQYRSDYPKLFALRLTHPDREIEGREWITEIGLIQDSKIQEVQCTIQLRLAFKSPYVKDEYTNTRPRVITALLEHCTPMHPTAGIQLERIHADNLAEFTPRLWGRIDDPERFYPIVLISPTRDGDYLMNPEELQFHLGGLADVVQIMPDARMYEVEDILTDEFSVRNGAINIIFAPQYDSEHRHIPCHRMLPEDLEQLRAAHRQPERNILAIVSHYTCLARGWDYITPEIVHRHRLQQQLHDVSKKSGIKQNIAQSKEQANFLHEYSESLSKQVTELSNKLGTVQMEKLALENRLKALEKENHQLQVSLNHAGVTTATTQESFNQSVLALMQRKYTLADCLRVLSVLFPERLVILDTAYSSARDAHEFQKTEKAMGLLLQLATDYWLAMSEGNGDNDAFNIFTRKNYSARESERGERNSRARMLRTFTYKGKELVMWRHLKIGIKDSIAETWRCYFHWDSDSEKIIIGHCGKHLDLK